jgi:alpha-L-rhamnosidase
MFSSCGEWFYKALGGIEIAPEAAGCDKILIKPNPIPNLRWVKSSFESVHGTIVSEWEQGDHLFKLHVRMPIGCTASVHLPGKDPLTIGSGDYHFTAAMP